MSVISISFQHDADAELFDRDRLDRLVRYVLDAEAVQYREIGIVLTRHEHMTALNRDFLGHDYETDVLSFPVDDGIDGIEGEIYVDVETASERHEEFDTTFTQEIERYIVHGVLHLAGYEDDSPEKKNRMEILETKYLDSFD